MKILKKAEQKNVLLNKDYYTLDQINDLLNNKIIFHFDKNVSEKNSTITGYEMEDICLRIFTNNVERLEVVLDDYGYYTTVAIMKDKSRLYVEL